MAKRFMYVCLGILALMVALVGCEGDMGPMGPQGEPGEDGADGRDGTGAGIVRTYFYISEDPIASNNHTIPVDAELADDEFIRFSAYASAEFEGDTGLVPLPFIATDSSGNPVQVIALLEFSETELGKVEWHLKYLKDWYVLLIIDVYRVESGGGGELQTDSMPQDRIKARFGE